MNLTRDSRGYLKTDTYVVVKVCKPPTKQTKQRCPYLLPRLLQIFCILVGFKEEEGKKNGLQKSSFKSSKQETN